MKKRLARRRGPGAWAAVLLLVLVMTLTAPAAKAASASIQPYLDKVVEWGVMRGDINGNLNADRTITRAEFVTMINRAFGFSKTGATPFRDVPSTAWYAEDVGIAYTEGYIMGVTDTSFAPYSSVTREQAAVILARIMMLEPQVGENTDFSDSREMGNWSRGLIAAATDYHIVNGYPDGSFKPKNAITRGAAAVMIVNAVGTPLQEAGDYSLGSVWGNVTITSSGTTLRDTVIAGNLYVSAGVDLGHILLENVTVLGEIIVCGGGASEGGDDSIVLRNVSAKKMVLDNINDQMVSVRVEGNGVIEETAVRTNAFLTDRASEGHGLSKITLEGEEEDQLSLTVSGNIKELLNTAPGSTVNLASGVAQTITVDEKATGSSLNIASGAQADTVNLDTGTNVTGSGDIGHLNVNAPGSTVSMLPDQITIRPGVTGNINGENMDSQAAAESSADPRLGAGYPRISDLAPTSASAQFSANKKGTVYWAITAVTDGSVSSEDLINPSSYSPLVLKRGTVSLTGANKTETAKISGLTSAGSYYLSAVMVDNREQRSPLKVISFSTPDDTKPDFASGYPYLSQITSTSAQATVMTTKTCRLYWAVLPKGASAPTASDFKANAVTGNLGFGTMDVTKNTTYPIDPINNIPLEELKSYDLYLWLTDVDGAQSSAVKKLSFTTVDGTPPFFRTKPTINSVKETSVGLYANLNEDGTLFWVVVEHGTTYPKPIQGEGVVDLSSPEAKIQVASGMNALKSGKVTMTAAKDVSFTVSGLEPEKAYDLYYVAQDKAGNYTETVGMIEIHTLDNSKPTVTQEFNKLNGTDTANPLPDSDVTLVFSESVQTADTYTSLQSLYDKVESLEGQPGQDAARDAMGNALSKAIYLYQVAANGQTTQIEGYDPTKDGDKNSAAWTIDYRYAVIETKEGKTRVTFPHGTGINFQSGSTYYFEIQADTIADTSTAVNVMGQTKLDQFTTVFAIVNLSARNENTITEYQNGDKLETDQSIPVDLSWRLSPVSTDAVDPTIDWDMLIWSDTSVTFKLYAREIGTTTGTWELRGTKEIAVPDGTDGYIGASLTRHFLENNNNPDFDPLYSSLDPDKSYEYAVSFTKVAGLSERDTWSQRLNIKVHVVAGSNDALSFLSATPNEDTWEEALKTGVTNIGQPDDFTLRKQFTDNVAPTFVGDYPDFEEGDSAVRMSLMLDRPGTVYYVVAPLGFVGTRDNKDQVYDMSPQGKKNWESLPGSGREADIDNETVPKPPILVSPDYLNIVNASSNYRNEKIKYGSVSCGASVEVELVEGLDKQTPYIAYFVLQGTSQTYSRVLAYKFETTDVEKPKLSLTNNSPSVTFKTESTADLNYVLIATDQIPQALETAFDLTTYVDSAKKSEWETYVGTGSTAKKFTVLTALCTTYSNGYSVFDQFAKNTTQSDIRTVVEELINGTDTLNATIAAQGSKSLAQGNNYRDSENFTNQMTGGTIYYCLATAVSPLGSETSFAGVSGVYIPDRTPPELKEVNTAAKLQGDGTYSGSVTFIFDEPIYLLVVKDNVAEKPKEVWQTPFSIPTGKDAVALKNIMGTSASKDKFDYPNNVYEPATSLTLSFTEIPLGTTIVLFDTGFICDASSNSTRERMSFVLKKDQLGVIDAGVSFVQQ